MRLRDGTRGLAPR